MKFSGNRQQHSVPDKGRRQTCPYASALVKPRYRSGAQKTWLVIMALFFCGYLAAFPAPQIATTHAHRNVTNLDAVLSDAREARQRFDYAGALRLLDKAAPFHKSSAELLSEYGNLYLDVEEVQRAQEYFDRALKIKPQLETAIAGRAAVDVMSRDYKIAETRLREYLSENPQSSRARALLALVHFENNRIEAAQVEAEKALKIDPDDKDALHVLALVKVIQKEPQEARKLTERALELLPYDPDMRRVLAQFVDGRAGFLQKISEAARRHYEQGRMLKQAGKFAEAVAEFEKALAIEPRYYRALIALGDIWLREEDYERAATAARLAIAIDASGAGAQLELSYANLGIQERGRIEIGATDFATEFFKKPRLQSFKLTAEIFPNYKSLSRRQQVVIDRAVEPLAFFLPELARKGAKHYLIAFDERATDIRGVDSIENERTTDGRYYASIRGVGGRITVSGLEYIGLAARAGFNTIAHEFAHQVHMTAMDKGLVKTIRRLYETAVRENRVLDYYAATDEYEYFAQGYEAFIADVKRPATGATSRHTKRELLERDPELFRFIEALGKKASAVEKN
jgi:tetratricopeptide (TPR) repeat protein